MSPGKYIRSLSNLTVAFGMPPVLLMKRHTQAIKSECTRAISINVDSRASWFHVQLEWTRSLSSFAVVNSVQR